MKNKANAIIDQVTRKIKTFPFVELLSIKL
jgi:hypothetical protein